MMNITGLLKRMTLGFVLASVPLVGGCGDNTLSWTEEVKLLDGRVITVAQKRRIDIENVARESWLTLKLPEFGNQKIVWNENLFPIVLNVYQGKLYVVGFLFSEREYRQYGKPFPEYVPYRYESGQWQGIPFNEIPVEIYEVNMFLDDVPETYPKHSSLSDKESQMKDDRIRDSLRRLSATFKSPAH